MGKVKTKLSRNEEDKLSSKGSVITDLSSECIQNQIYTIRGVQVMMDSDLARMYEVETKVLNQAVKRNKERFPEHFMFQLTDEETKNLNIQCMQTIMANSNNDLDVLRSQNVTSKQGGRRYLPYVFTEQGVSQLSAVLKSKKAVSVSIRIIEAFVDMRRFLTANASIFQRLEQVERHQLETDNKIDMVLDSLESGTLKEKAHVFSAGQIYNAKAFITELISKAKRKVVLVDGYVSSVTIDLLDARIEGVPCTIYTGSVGPTLTALLGNHKAQFPHMPIDIRKWRIPQHDRWLIIDDELWHCGASIKDAGVKTFGIDFIGLDASIIMNNVL